MPVAAMFNNGSGRNEQSFHRCFLPRFGSFVQAVSERRFFLNRPIRNKNCLWRPCLSMDRDEMSNLYIGPSIDASSQISDQLALRFQKRILKCEKLTDNGRQTTDDGRQVMAKPHIAFGIKIDNPEKLAT